MKIATLREDRSKIAPRGKDSRELWSQLNEAAVVELWNAACPEVAATGIALVALGSLGRKDCGPQSDLDLMLIHDGEAHPEIAGGISGLADRLWYPMWDAHIDLDHSVRTLEDCRSIAHTDVEAGLALLDIRYLAGDRTLAAQARSAVLSDWRAVARQRFDAIEAGHNERRKRYGQLAYAIEGDVKEAAGGLRDGLLISALVATWLAERPAINYKPAYEYLLDVRDALTSKTGRRNSTLYLPYQDETAAALGFVGSDEVDPADELLREVAGAARTIRAAYQDTVRRARPTSSALKPRMVRGKYAPPHLHAWGDGVGQLSGELVLTASAKASSPRTLFTLARVAAQQSMPIRPATLKHMKESGAGSLPHPWPEWARAEFEEILWSGTGQIAVWEGLDLAGLLTELIPAWAGVRNLPQRSAIHQHSVDRHQIEATTRLRGIVADSDLTLSSQRKTSLAVATLFHDIGKKPGLSGHSERGAAMLPGLLEPMGYANGVVIDCQLLVRNHLLLSALATSADPEDPGTAKKILAAVDGDRELLTCLHMLSEADAASCKEGTWDAWKADLVAQLVERARMADVD